LLEPSPIDVALGGDGELLFSKAGIKMV